MIPDMEMVYQTGGDGVPDRGDGVPEREHGQPDGKM